MLKKTLKYTLLLPLFCAMLFLLFTGCGKEETNSENHLPVAKFEVNTYRGDVNTVFHFNADSVSDVEDAFEQLEVRWNWTNSGDFDTEYSTIKTATHQYAQSGLYFPLLEVRDTKGMVSSVKKMVVVVLDLTNQPPDKPKYISPPYWQTWMEPTVIFKWSCIDPEEDDLTFDFWLGKRESGVASVRKGIDTFEIINGKVVYTTTLTGLEFNQDYYWQVYARDVAGNYTAGDIWRFTTRPTE